MVQLKGFSLHKKRLTPDKFPPNCVLSTQDVIEVPIGITQTQLFINLTMLQWFKNNYLTLRHSVSQKKLFHSQTTMYRE